MTPPDPLPHKQAAGAGDPRCPPGVVKIGLFALQDMVGKVCVGGGTYIVKKE